MEQEEIKVKRGNNGIGNDGAGRIAALSVAMAMVAGAGLLAAQGTGSSTPGASLRPTLETQRFYYAGDPILVRLTMTNDGKSPYDNSKGIDFMGQIVVSETGGGAVKRKASPPVETRLQPATLAPGAFYGFVADLREVAEGLDKPGKFTAQLRAPGFESEPTPVVVIPRFDPATAYQASVETDYGRLVFDLLGREAPKHVQNFHDLANTGYYDGALIHSVIKGVEIHGGDTIGDGSSSPGYGLPFELDPNLPQKRGTLSMVRLRTSDSGSQFLISLAENPGSAGKLSVYGSLASGEDALAAIESLPTTGRMEFPFYRPIKEVRIRTIRVAPAAAGSKATAKPRETSAP
jgi:peptidyl-prolyl cis-trans isomerase B (cyclophilin B)